jgi:hypothetical protein
MLGAQTPRASRGSSTLVGCGDDAGVPLGSDGAVGLDIQRVERMAARHEQAVALGAPEAQIRAALGQPDVSNALALRIEHHHAVEVGRLRLGGSRTAPPGLDVAVLVAPEAVQCPGRARVDQRGLIP